MTLSSSNLLRFSHTSKVKVKSMAFVKWMKLPHLFVTPHKRCKVFWWIECILGKEKKFVFQRQFSFFHLILHDFLSQFSHFAFYFSLKNRIFSYLSKFYIVISVANPVSHCEFVAIRPGTITHTEQRKSSR